MLKKIPGGVCAGAFFASGNPASQSQNCFLAVSAPGNPQDFSANRQGPAAQNLQNPAVLPKAKPPRLKLKTRATAADGGDTPRPLSLGNDFPGVFMQRRTGQG